jgi:hypothetical protein
MLLLLVLEVFTQVILLEVLLLMGGFQTVVLLKQGNNLLVLGIEGGFSDVELGTQAFGLRGLGR